MTGFNFKNLIATDYAAAEGILNAAPALSSPFPQKYFPFSFKEMTNNSDNIFFRN